ncbi:FecR family protein [Arcticibacter tournemirensis]
MTKDRIQYLYNQYLKDACSEEEFKELKASLQDPANEALFADLLDENWNLLADDELRDMVPEKSEMLFKKIVSHPAKKTATLTFWIPLAAAAIFLLAVSTFLLTRIDSSEEQKMTADNKITSDILPGANKATLTLDNGNTIALKKEKGGIIAADNKLVYTDGSMVSDDNGPGKQTTTIKAARMATLATPVGGQYQITLSDGTKVWLNAESKLHYPVEFSQEQRTVELEGEGYFEVAKDSRRPFTVTSEGQEIEVLGTHFNVNAYRDGSAVKTTLIEGRVRVSSTSDREKEEAVILSPGQQASSVPGNSQVRVNSVNIEEITDWKEGLFLFNNESLKSIMSRLAHWYNIEVVFEGNAGNVRFVGTHLRSKGLNNLLENIESTDKVRFRTEKGSNGKERRIIVTANY